MANTPTSITALAPITTTATSLSNLVLVVPQLIGAFTNQTVGYQPQTGIANSSNPTQSLPALLFHYEGEQTVTIDSDITDHFIENNSSLQDQIAIKPTIITTHGFIGELNDISPIPNINIQSLLSKLSILGSYTPSLTVTALNAYNDAFQAYQVGANLVNSAVSAWGSVSSLAGNSSFSETVIGNNGLSVSSANNTQNKLTQNKQQLAFQQLFAYQTNRTLFTIQTPWAVFQNCAILHLRAIQEGDTNVISDFELSFKQLRFASTSNISSTESTLVQGALIYQSAPTINSQAPTIQGPSLSDALGSIG